jgi:hypothetical protein
MFVNSFYLSTSKYWGFETPANSKALKNSRFKYRGFENPTNQKVVKLHKLFCGGLKPPLINIPMKKKIKNSGAGHGPAQPIKGSALSGGEL